jgi:hypothetical protein
MVNPSEERSLATAINTSDSLKIRICYQSQWPIWEYCFVFRSRKDRIGRVICRKYQENKDAHVTCILNRSKALTARLESIGGIRVVWLDWCFVLLVCCWFVVVCNAQPFSLARPPFLLEPKKWSSGYLVPMYRQQQWQEVIPTSDIDSKICSVRHYCFVFQ